MVEKKATDKTNIDGSKKVYSARVNGSILLAGDYSVFNGYHAVITVPNLPIDVYCIFSSNKDKKAFSLSNYGKNVVVDLGSEPYCLLEKGKIKLTLENSNIRGHFDAVKSFLEEIVAENNLTDYGWDFSDLHGKTVDVFTIGALPLNGPGAGAARNLGIALCIANFLYDKQVEYIKKEQPTKKVINYSEALEMGAKTGLVASSFIQSSRSIANLSFADSIKVQKEPPVPGSLADMVFRFAWLLDCAAHNDLSSGCGCSTLFTSSRVFTYRLNEGGSSKKVSLQSILPGIREKKKEAIENVLKTLKYEIGAIDTHLFNPTVKDNIYLALHRTKDSKSSSEESDAGINKVSNYFNGDFKEFLDLADRASEMVVKKITNNTASFGDIIKHISLYQRFLLCLSGGFKEYYRAVPMCNHADVLKCMGTGSGGWLLTISRTNLKNSKDFIKPIKMSAWSSTEKSAIVDKNAAIVKCSGLSPKDFFGKKNNSEDVFCQLAKLMLPVIILKCLNKDFSSEDETCFLADSRELRCYDKNTKPKEFTQICFDDDTNGHILKKCKKSLFVRNPPRITSEKGHSKHLMLRKPNENGISSFDELAERMLEISDHGSTLSVLYNTIDLFTDANIALVKYHKKCLPISVLTHNRDVIDKHTKTIKTKSRIL